MQKQFQAGDDAEFHRVMETIDAIAGEATTNALLDELDLTRSFGKAGGGISQGFAAVRLSYLAQQRLNIQGIGFDISERCYATADLGVYGYAMLSAGTIGKMLTIGMDYNRLYSPATGYQIVQREDAVALQFVVQGVIGTHHSLQLEIVMSAVWQYLKQMRPEISLGELKCVNLSYSAPSYLQRFHEFYQVPVEFDQPNSEFVFQENILALPISTDSLIANEILAEQSDRFFRYLERKEGIVDAVRQEIMRRAGDCWPELDQVAQHLALSGRTLRRRLQDKGTSYKKISNEVRMTLAKVYVENTGMSNEEISALLGYAQTPAFYRAFLKWHGMSPNQMREPINA